ncbi:baseplate J/gp47 family protein [Pantoea sp.]|uniref:baseplate J/gp47 family protein n=1 Tax=Pantoea sp. TaxID=69393 RepID=UPI002047BCD5|nr:baseplate J/gp47 family protein [Pantoea sp.]MDU5474033.1 baseplate J/gp47 family protein [Pantoea sp.]DAI70352.1 MAG TPA: Baseplate J like protein [Bacteriophage sp.]
MALNLDTLGLSATVTAQGISAPDYQTILSTITDYFYQIYGSDAYLEPDSKDGQMVALVALAIHDANNAAIQVYNSFSPSTALTDALTRNVKINGIARHGATNSTVDVTLAGAEGTTITNGSVRDANGIIWNLPASVTIGIDGTVTVTATCATAGAVAAIAGSVNQINTPTRGWKSVTNALAATVGTTIESDAALRLRQTQSVALPAVTPFEALDGAIANVSGVTRHKLYENDTETTDENGIPAHAITAIVDGGDAAEIAETIRKKKTLGAPTFGSTTIELKDAYGKPVKVSFSRPVVVPIFAMVAITPLPGYSSIMGDKIASAVASYINNLGIGANIYYRRLYSAADLAIGVDDLDSQYYDVTLILFGKSKDNLYTTNLNISYDEAAYCKPENVNVVING